jgi:hypothetical protein
MTRRTLITGSLTLGAGALLAGCGAAPTPATSSSTTRSGSKVLLAYFSRPGENYHYGGKIDLEVGNTEVLANMIASAVDVDVYRIVAADPYPQDYEETVERNKREQETEARPAIASAPAACEAVRHRSVRQPHLERAPHPSFMGRLGLTFATGMRPAGSQ